MMEQHSILNDLATMKSQPSRIMAMGVGGAGGNAIEHMWQMQIEGVNLAACNTDQTDLDKLKIAEENRILLGDNGQGAGNDWTIGAKCATMSLDKVRDLFNARGTEMLFLAAGMGAGTGTGAAPVIAELAHSMGILTVAIVTVPEENEGPLRVEQAKGGVERLRKYVDAMIILNNEDINKLYGHLPASTGFDRANDVVAYAAKGIAEIITHKSNLVNVDFADVCTVMRGSGSAVMGVASDTGEDRADNVVDTILSSPLFGNISIKGAKHVLINMSVSNPQALTLNEAHRVRDRVQHHAKSIDADGKVVYTNIIWGVSVKPNLNEDTLEVVIVATGFESDPLFPGQETVINVAAGTVVETPADSTTNEPTEGEGGDAEPTKPATPTPIFRPAPVPVPRPLRNFSEIEDCKRTPAYLKHGVSLSVAVSTSASKAQQVADDSSENEAAAPTDTMQSLF